MRIQKVDAMFANEVCCKLPEARRHHLVPSVYDELNKDQFNASFNFLPALKTGAFLEGIFNSFPVCGLRPVRAAR